ncbi:MAG: MFS transporter [Anaerolineae bacterium]|nr:MFS transporter [Anaerolineae bacterium]
MNRTWRRNLWATWIAELFAIMGFSSIFPIMPYYIQSLGIEGDAVARWSGIVTAASALTMGIMGPIWGALSDRHGRKMMMIRAMFGGAVVTSFMGAVQNVEQLTLLRLIQGALTGTVTAATTLVASTTPKERLGETLGKLQLAIFLGQSFGPVVGGFVADRLGYREAFWLTGVYLLLAGIVTLLFIHEEFTPEEAAVTLPLWQRLLQDFGILFSGSLLALVLGLRFLLRLGLRMTGPILPLVVQSLLTSDDLLGSASGLVSTVSGISSAAAAPVFGRWADRQGGRGLLMMCAFGAGVALIVQALAPTYWMLVIAQAILGLTIGGTLAIISAYIGRLAPEGRAGTAYGLDAMVVSLSNAVGPLLGGWLGGTSLRIPFFWGGGFMTVAGFAVLRLPKDGDKK